MKLVCDLIVTDQPTLNNRIYSKECMEKMLMEMETQIKNNTLLVYVPKPEVNDYLDYFESPTFDRAIGKVTDVKLTDRFEYTVTNINTELSKSIDFDNDKYEIVPVIWGNVNKNEITACFEVSNVVFRYLNLGIKLKNNYTADVSTLKDGE